MKRKMRPVVQRLIAPKERAIKNIIGPKAKTAAQRQSLFLKVSFLKARRIKACIKRAVTPKATMQTVVKNNKTPNGPISVGDVKTSISIKAASPTMLITDIIRLCFISRLYHSSGQPPSICSPGGAGGYPAFKSQLLAATPDPLFPIDRFTLGEALSLPSFSFILVYVLCFFAEGTNERFDCALYAFSFPGTQDWTFGGALGNS